MTDIPKFPRGSEWRRWDLHVHSPDSVLEQHFGDDFDAYAKALFTEAYNQNIGVIGITDYYLIDGYTKLLERQRDGTWCNKSLSSKVATYAKTVTLLPNIELRTDPFVT